MHYLLDSVIIIDHLNNIPQATQWIAEFYQESCVSLITRAEILAGVDKKMLPHVKNLLNEFERLPLTIDDMDCAALLRWTYRLKLPDAIQAGLAINHGLVLVTRNTKDFSPKQYDFVQVPYKI